MKRRSEPQPTVSQWSLVAILGVVILTSCSGTTIPKPRGYPRLDLPDTGYTTWSGACPFNTEVPDYARMVVHQKAHAEGSLGTDAADTACWTSLRFPGQRATVFMTYRRIAEDLPELIDDAHDFKNKHEAKAARINSIRVLRPEAHVFGTLFEVDGDVASPLVFYLTDSTTHFLYGSLYFDVRPNADSLQPVTDRIRADIRHFADQLNWR